MIQGILKTASVWLFLTMFVPLTAFADVEINEANFPDENFRNWLLNQNYGKDGVITSDEILNITRISVVKANIVSLKGIEHFAALQTLDCSNNKLTSLDISECTALKNLVCGGNAFTSLDLSGNTSLTSLSIGGLETLTVAGCTSLTELKCTSSITSIDASGCTSLTSLDIGVNAPIYSLNLSGCTAITSFSLPSRLESLNVSGCTSLTSLECSQNLKELNVSGCTALESLECSDSHITSLDVSECTALKSLKLESLSYPISLDLSKNIALETLTINSLLTSLNVSGCKSLTSFIFRGGCQNPISVANFPSLTLLSFGIMDVGVSEVPSLSISDCPVLPSLYVSDIELTSLTVSDCPALTSMHIYAPQLSSFDVSKHSGLKSLFIEASLTSLDVSKNTALESLSVDLPSLTSLDVSKNTNLTSLTISNVPLTSLDLSANAATLTSLSIYNAQFTSLDVSKYTALKSFSCNHCKKLTSLDVHRLTALDSLDCGDNYLETVDISGCTSLKRMNFVYNSLKGKGMKDLIDNLPNITTGEMYRLPLCNPVADPLKGNMRSDSNEATKSQVETAKSKGWEPGFYYSNPNIVTSRPPEWIPYEGVDDLVIDAENFPDENFRNYLLEQPYGDDGSLTDSEISEVTAMDVNGRGISSLKGIEYFTELKIINLTCNQMKSEAMDELIEYLPKNETNYFYILYVCDNMASDEGNVFTTEQATAAKEKGWLAYYWAYDSWNEYGAPIIAIDETNFPDETFRNYLLEQDYGADGIITDAEIKEIIYMTDLYYKDISSLKGIEYFTELMYLNCSGNPLTTLDVSNNKALRELSCGYAQLTSLDVSENTALQNLDCSGNPLTTLDVSNNKALWYLTCSNTQLTSLDISENTVLFHLDCNSNQLTALDVSNNSEIDLIRCYGNRLKDEGMDAFISSLPQNTTNRTHSIYIYRTYDEENVCTKEQVAAIKAKGWTPYYSQWWEGEEYEGSDDESAGIIVPETQAGNADASVYTLSGQKASVNGKKGIYVVNGKKIVIK